MAGMGSRLFSIVSTTGNISISDCLPTSPGLTCNPLGRELVHLGAGGDHLHAETVHHQHPPLDLPWLLVVVLDGVADDIVHNS